MPIILKDPIPQIPFFTWDKLSHYYSSIQLPLPLGQPKLANIIHRFDFRDTIQNTLVTMKGGALSPRINETPVVIASPVKTVVNSMMEERSVIKFH